MMDWGYVVEFCRENKEVVGSLMFIVPLCAITYMAYRSNENEKNIKKEKGKDRLAGGLERDLGHGENS